MTKEELIELAQGGMDIHSPDDPEYVVCEALIKALAQPEQERCRPNCEALLQKFVAQRKPLTDEELFKLWDEDMSCDMPDTFTQFKHTARAIEAAHGIKEKNT